MSISRKHHYLPVFYLKGFADKNGLIHLYDKVRDVVIESQDPRTKFYVKDLNNYKADGQIRISLEESLFTPADSRIAPLFAKVLKQERYEFTALEKFEILAFLTQLYWRLPQSNALYTKLIEREGLSNKYFALRNRGNNSLISDEEIPEIKNQILADAEIQKMLKHVIPLTNGAINELNTMYDNWMVYAINSPELNLITGDHPFLINNKMQSMDNIFNEFVFPLGKSHLLVISDKSPSFLDSIFLVNVNAAIVSQSNRFIASHDLGQLTQAITNFKELKKHGKSENQTEFAFAHMHYQSTFENYEAYREDFISKQK
jgi:hypothetical protein